MAVARPLRLALCALLGQVALAFPAMAARPAAETVIAGPDGVWDYLSVDRARHRIYVSRGYGVMAIDTLTGRASALFAQGDRAHAVVVVPDADVLVVTNSGDNTARVVEADSGRTLASIPAGKGTDSAVYDPASRRVWAINHTDGTITVVDPLARTSDGVVPVGGVLESAGVDGAGRLYVAVEDRNEIAVVDTIARRTLRRYRLKGCIEPTGLAVTSNGLLVAACDGRALVVTAADGRRIAQFRIGRDADAVAYDPVRQKVYIPTGSDGRIWRLDVRGHGPRLLGSLPGAKGSRKAAVDPVSGDVYLPLAHWTGRHSADGRPIAQPGSFVVRVIRGAD